MKSGGFYGKFIKQLKLRKAKIILLNSASENRQRRYIQSENIKYCIVQLSHAIYF